MRDGDGARWFDGESWAGPGETAGRCVLDLVRDPQGRIWVASLENSLSDGEHRVLRYDPSSGWTQLPLTDPGQFFSSDTWINYVSDLHLDETGIMWAKADRIGGASSPPAGLYSWENEQWQTFAFVAGDDVSFGLGDEMWFLAWQGLVSPHWPEYHGLLRHRNGEITHVPMNIDEIRPETVQADRNGRIWFIGADGTSIWTYVGDQ
ncbi:hypothetical protein [Candidatus Leptofilum sp.]|uniref:hypothetical protein n=1 Tax=Candidatus Leptofilum sp. TaxID=3241576 RepID=UPI003B59BD34